MNTYAKDTKQTRRDVLEAAILHYRQDTMRERMRKDFTRAAADQETIELAKWGIDDYRDIEHV